MLGSEATVNLCLWRISSSEPQACALGTFEMGEVVVMAPSCHSTVCHGFNCFTVGVGEVNLLSKQHGLWTVAYQELCLCALRSGNGANDPEGKFANSLVGEAEEANRNVACGM